MRLHDFCRITINTAHVGVILKRIVGYKVGKHAFEIDRLVQRFEPVNLVHVVDSYEPLIEVIATADANTVVLFKGSRGMKLEMIISALK